MSGRREAERDFLHQAYLFAMIFMIIGAVMIYMSDDDGIPYALFQLNGETTTGTVTAIDKQGHDYLLHFAYDDPKGVSHSKINVVQKNSIQLSGNTHPKYIVGKEINITFSPTFPNLFEATNFVPNLKAGFWVMIAGSGVIFLSALLSIFALYQLVKHKQEDRFY